MASNQGSGPGQQQSPTVTIFIGLCMIMFFMSVLWVAARQEVAMVYGTIRSLEFPMLWKMVPGSGHFDPVAVRYGHRPPVGSIYLNAAYYGLFFMSMIGIIMLLALVRLKKWGIGRHLQLNHYRRQPVVV